MSIKKIFAGCFWRFYFDNNTFVIFYDKEPVGVYFPDIRELYTKDSIYEKFVCRNGNTKIIRYILAKYLDLNIVSVGSSGDENFNDAMHKHQIL